MRTFPGIRLEVFKDFAEREQIKIIADMLRQVSGGLSASIEPGQSPLPTAPAQQTLTDYYYKPGIFGGQVAYGSSTGTIGTGGLLKLWGRYGNDSTNYTSGLPVIRIGVAPGDANLATALTLWEGMTVGGRGDSFGYLSYGRDYNADSTAISSSVGGFHIGATGRVWINARPTDISSSDQLMVRGGITQYDSSFFGGIKTSLRILSNRAISFSGPFPGFQIVDSVSGVHPLFFQSGLNPSGTASRAILIRDASTVNFGAETFELATGYNMRLGGMISVSDLGQAQANLLTLDFATVTITGTVTAPMTPSTLRIPWANPAGPAGATYSAASAVVTSAAQFGSVSAGMFVHGPNITGGTTVKIKTDNSNITLSANPTGAGGTLYFSSGHVFYPTGAPTRGWQVYLDAPVDGLAVATISQTSPSYSYNVTVPILEAENTFTKRQIIVGSGTGEALKLTPGSTIGLWVDDGVGNYLVKTDGGQVFSTVPDIWFQSGSGTPKLTHSLLYSASDQTAAWPDISGVVVIAPSVLTVSNVSASTGDQNILTNTASNKYFRVSALFETNTTGDRVFNVAIKYTNTVARSSTSQVLATASTTSSGVVRFVFVTSGNIQYNVTVASGTTGSIDMRFQVERMS